MPDTAENPLGLLKKYADTLIANAQATTEEERGEIADELIYVEAAMEEHGRQVAHFMYKLLDANSEALT